MIGNARLLQEQLNEVREQLLQLEENVVRYDSVATTLTELPRKLSHKVMVPLSKRAMAPGKIIRSNEVLAHLGDEYFAWRSTSQALEILERKKKEICKQIETQKENLRKLTLKEADIQSVGELQKLYEDVREIKETEEESELGPLVPVTDEDVEEYFEIEEEERLKLEQAAWNWDDMMKRMEELEANEAAGEALEKEQSATNEKTTAETLKSKGNEAFARRRFQTAIQYYSQAIELDPTSHILYGNRAAAFHRLKKYKQALEDSDVAISLHEPWVKGHYRRACALAALERYDEAAEAYERAMELCPTDDKLMEKAKEMRTKAKSIASESVEPESKVKATTEPAPVLLNSVPKGSSLSFSACTPFTGNIVEHEGEEKTSLKPQQSRFRGTNYTGQTVTLEPVGEAQPVKRVSRFKAARARQN